MFCIFFKQDSNGNRVGQWLNQTSNGKILQLEFSLNSECAEGTYKIYVDVDGDRIVHWFKVEKYGEWLLIYSLLYSIKCSNR